MTNWKRNLGKTKKMRARLQDGTVAETQDVIGHFDEGAKAVRLKDLVPDPQFVLREGTQAEKEAFALEVGAPAVPRQKSDDSASTSATGAPNGEAGK